ncbi:phage tail terminator protein [Marinobacter sp.]|uniref:phage tail terminator protein n=1 Tax=Marinobacter sp. TaxID=50741 RepID=UPI003A8D6297
MEINRQIRQQVISDLKAKLNPPDGEPTIATFFDGFPAYINVPESSIYDEGGDIPAIAVSLGDGEPGASSMSEITWSAKMIVRVYLVADTDVDADLDALGQAVLKVIGQHYSAAGLLENCNRSGFDYVRDDEQPWGMLDLIFNVEYNEEV